MEKPLLLRHGFVFQSQNMSPYIGKNISESFSDNVILLDNPCLWYASLCNTFAWFRDISHLYAVIHREIEYNVGEMQGENEEILVVLSPYFYRAFLFGLFKREQGNRVERVVIADKHNLEFIRFFQNISWEDWYKYTLLFVNYLHHSSLNKKEKQAHHAEIAHFCESMRNMHFNTPAQVPRRLPFTELQHRFGSFCASLWKNWLTGSDTFDKLLALDLEPHPSVFKTESSEIEEYASPFLTSGLISATTAAFTLLLKKLNLRNKDYEYGVSDFKIIIHFDEKNFLEKNISLTTPLFTCNKTAEQILINSLENISSSSHNNKPGEEKNSCYEFLYITHIVIIPLQLIKQKPPEATLFSCNCNSYKAFVQKCMDIAVQSHANAYFAQLMPSLDPLASYERVSLADISLAERKVGEERRESGKEKAQNPGARFGEIFCYAHHNKPLAILRNPLRGSCVSHFAPQGLKGSYGKSSKCFLETVNNYHYFATNQGAWIAIPSHSLQENHENSELILGIF